MDYKKIFIIVILVVLVILFIFYIYNKLNNQKFGEVTPPTSIDNAYQNLTVNDILPEIKKAITFDTGYMGVAKYYYSSAYAIENSSHQRLIYSQNYYNTNGEPVIWNKIKDTTTCKNDDRCNRPYSKLYQFNGQIYCIPDYNPSSSKKIYTNVVLDEINKEIKGDWKIVYIKGAIRGESNKVLINTSINFLGFISFAILDDDNVLVQTSDNSIFIAISPEIVINADGTRTIDSDWYSITYSNGINTIVNEPYPIYLTHGLARLFSTDSNIELLSSFVNKKIFMVNNGSGIAFMTYDSENMNNTGILIPVDKTYNNTNKNINSIVYSQNIPGEFIFTTIGNSQLYVTHGFESDKLIPLDNVTDNSLADYIVPAPPKQMGAENNKSPLSVKYLCSTFNW